MGRFNLTFCDSILVYFSVNLFQDKTERAQISSAQGRADAHSTQARGKRTYAQGATALPMKNRDETSPKNVFVV